MEENNARDEAFGEKANSMCRGPRIHPDPVVEPRHMGHEGMEAKESRCRPVEGTVVAQGRAPHHLRARDNRSGQVARSSAGHATETYCRAFGDRYLLIQGWSSRRLAKVPVEEINARDEAFVEKANSTCCSSRIHPDPVVEPQHVEHIEEEHPVTDAIAAFTYKAIRAEEQPSKIRQLSIVSSSGRPKKCRLFHCH